MLQLLSHTASIVRMRLTGSTLAAGSTGVAFVPFLSLFDSDEAAAAAVVVAADSFVILDSFFFALGEEEDAAAAAPSLLTRCFFFGLSLAAAGSV